MEEELVIEPIIAYKIFKVNRCNYKGFKLNGYGIGCEYDYHIGINRATCNSADVEKHSMEDVPKLNCTCGFYANKYLVDLHEPLSLINHFTDNFCGSHYEAHCYVFEKVVNPNSLSCIGGKVKLTGKVIEHELGYRAEFLEIQNLLIPYSSGNPKFYFGNPHKRYGYNGQSLSKWVSKPEAADNIDSIETEERYGDYEDMDLVKVRLMENYNVPVYFYKDYFRKETK